MQPLTIFHRLTQKLRSPAGLLVLSAGVSQVLNMGFTAMLTRMYPSESFGYWSIFQTTAAVLGIVATGRYELAIMLPAAPTQARQLVQLAMTLAVMAVGVLSLLLAVLPTSILTGQFANVYAQGKFILPFLVLGYAAFQCFSYWFTRQQQFSLLATQRVVETIVIGVTCWWAVSLPTQGLLLGNLAGVMVSLVLFLAVYIQQKPRWVPSEYKKTALAYKDFPLNSIGQAIIEILQFNLLTYACTALYGAATAGYYALALRILAAPALLLMRPFAQVFYRQATELYHRQQSLYDLTKASLWRNVKALAPIYAVLLLLAPPLFAGLFGREWQFSGELARYLGVWFFLDFVRIPLVQIAIIYRQQTHFLAFSVGGLLLTAGLCALAAYVGWSIGTLFIILTFFQSLYTIITLIWLLQLAKSTTFAS